MTKVLKTIVANNGETLKWPQESDVFVRYIIEIAERSAREATELLLFMTEVNDEQLTQLEKEFGSDMVGRQEAIFAAENTYIATYATRKDTQLDISRYPDSLQNQHSRILTETDGQKFATAMTVDYWVSFVHLNPYAADQMSDDYVERLIAVFQDGNKFRLDQIVHTIYELEKRANRYISANAHVWKWEGYFELHNGYRCMYGSIVKNLILRLGDRWKNTQKEFLAYMRKWQLKAPMHPKYPTYSTKIGKVLPINFEWAHSIGSKKLVDEDRISVQVLDPVQGGDRSTILTTVEY